MVGKDGEKRLKKEEESRRRGDPLNRLTLSLTAFFPGFLQSRRAEEQKSRRADRADRADRAGNENMKDAVRVRVELVEGPRVVGKEMEMAALVRVKSVWPEQNEQLPYIIIYLYN